MKNKILILLIAAFCTACGNFLEPKSKSEFVPKEISALNELLLGQAYPTTDVSNLNIFLGVLDDDVDMSKYNVFPEGLHLDIYHSVFTWQPDIYDRFESAQLSEADYNLYRPYYAKIRGANAVLDYLHTVTGTPEDINNVHAQALTLRAFYYFQLVNIFGHPYGDNKEALGVPLKLTSQVEEFLPNRATVFEVYNQIIEDLLLAESLYLQLPQNIHWKANYRTSLPLVQLLLSRVYLYTEQWESAKSYAKKVIDNKQFSLVDLNAMPEDKQYMVFHQYDCPETIWGYGDIKDFVTGWNALKSDNSQGQPTYCIFKASDDLLNSFEKGDLRKTYYFIPEKEATAGQHTLQAFGKVEVGEESKLPLNGFKFARSFRLSEAYLNYAEANAMLYKERAEAAALSEAQESLKTLRLNRMSSEEKATVEITNPDELITFVRAERRRELCFESHRWFDLRRYGMPEITHRWYSETGVKTYTLTHKDPAYTLALPTSALKAHPEMVQNPLPPKRNN